MRVCAHPECDTRLSFYSRGDRCARHAITGAERNRLRSRARVAALTELVWLHRDEFDHLHAKHRAARGLPAQPAWRAGTRRRVA